MNNKNKRNPTGVFFYFLLDFSFDEEDLDPELEEALPDCDLVVPERETDELLAGALLTALLAGALLTAFRAAVF